MQTVKISTVKSNPDNPRLIKDDKFKKLVTSLKEFPEMAAVRPIVVNGDMVVLGGNMRLKAMQEAGWKDVPIEVVDWSEEKQREFIIKDNVGFGEWDWSLIANEWDAEQVSEWWGLDIPDFSAGETLEAEEDDFDTTPPELPITVLGDLYEIGEHRLLCGDSTCSDTVAKLMNGEKADMVFTDPPYRQEGHIEAAESEVKQQKGKVRSSTTEISPSLVRHAKTLKGLLDFEPKDFVNNLLSFNPLCVYIFCNKSLVKEYLNFFEGYNYTILIWKKPTCSPFFVADYLADIEYLLYFNKAGKKWINKNEFKNYSRVLEAKQERGDHPTIKPVSIIEPSILNSSEIKDIVLDLFLGSGSTMVAAHQLKRKCYGMELDGKYVDVCVNRMRKLDPTLLIKRNGEVVTETDEQQT